jgi:signal transduction histidine kinase
MKIPDGLSNADVTGLLDNLGDGVSIMDEEYRIFYMSKGAEGIFGAGCVGRKCYEIYASREKPCFMCPVKPSFKGPDNKKVEVEGANGRIYLMDHSKVILNGGVAILQTFTDITELKEHEMRLSRETERIKGELISNVTHELRTPITTIAKGAIELAMDEKGWERRNKLLNIGRNALLRQNSIVEDLIIAAKMENRDYRFDVKPCDLAGIIRATIFDHTKRAKEKNISVNASIPQDLPAIMGDSTALKRAFTNIIGNAIKFNKKGGEVLITLKPNMTHVAVTVADTGIGIRKELLEKIFDRFYQVDGSIMRTYSGMGLGLNVAKRIIEAHGGETLVKSEISKGTKFTIILPIIKENAEVENE